MDSSVGIVTGLRPGHPSSCGSVPDMCNRFLIGSVDRWPLVQRLRHEADHCRATNAWSCAYTEPHALFTACAVTEPE